MEVNNPIFKVDMPDPDVLRRGDIYYMVSTTMFYMPGAVILKSGNLVNWEIVSYVFETLENNDIYQMKNGKNAYGKGQWATSLAFYHGRYYACFVCHDMGKTYIYHTDDIEQSGWDRFVIEEVFHDMSFLFWENAAYFVYGNGEIGIVQLEDDLSGVKENGIRQILFETPREGMNLRCEGCRAYVRNGYIYLSFIDGPSKRVGNGRRRQVCYRSKKLLGPYESRIILDDDMGLEGRGIAQGPFIETKEGEWYAMLFQDRGAVGRIPFLMPMKWVEDWPVLGVDGKVPETFEIPLPSHTGNPFVISDTFGHEENRLAKEWQWNHNPMPDCWSFLQRPGYLRLTTGQLADNLMEARNTLTQRTQEPYSVFQVEMDTAGLRVGDFAGLCAFQSKYGQIGVRRDADGKKVVALQRDDNKNLRETVSAFSGNTIYLKITLDFANQADLAEFYYSTDQRIWIKLGDTLHMVYTLDVFVGYRIGLFCYAARELGGYADFRDFLFSGKRK